MNWDDMKLLLALSRNGRVSATAKTIGVDPTTLIRRVKKLEDSLNCELFSLTSKGYVLTEQGQRFVSYIEQAEHYVVKAQHELNNERSHLSGTIRVSVSEGFGTWFLAPLLADFKREYPSIVIELVANSGFLNLTKREADIAILLEKPTSSFLVTRRLTDYFLYLYGHNALFENQLPESLVDVAEFTHISYIPDLIYAPQLKFIEDTLLSNVNSLQSTSINAQLQMVKHKAGIGILPYFIAQAHSELTRILHNQIKAKRTFWIATHKETQSQARFQCFITWLEQQIACKKSNFVGVT